MDKELLLYQYFSSQLTKDEQLLFDELLENDLEFKAQFEFENDLRRVIRKTEKEGLKQKLVVFEKEIEGNGLTSDSKTRFAKWSIAASVALLIGLGWIAYSTFAGPDYDHLYAANFEAYPNTVYTITRIDADQSLQRDAFLAYEASNYEKSAAAFLNLKIEGETAYINFYLAQSYLHLGKDQEAILALKNVIMINKEFVAEAHWYLALAYLKSKDEVNAMEALKSLIENFDYKKQKAQALLKELD